MKDVRRWCCVELCMFFVVVLVMHVYVSGIERIAALVFLCVCFCRGQGCMHHVWHGKVQLMINLWAMGVVVVR